MTTTHPCLAVAAAFACVAALHGVGHVNATLGERASGVGAVQIDGVSFSSRPGLRRRCARVAHEVGYAVPCPTLLPRGLTATPGTHGCQLGIVGAGGTSGCGKPWRRWIVGSSQVVGSNAGGAGFQHLVLGGAPRVERSAARAIDGPTMVAGSRVERRGRLRVGAIRGWFYYVPFATNIGSAFTGHLVMVWTASGHTYAYGFHVVDGIAEARALDLEVARHLVMVDP